MPTNRQQLLTVALFSLALSYVFLQTFATPSNPSYVLASETPALSSPHSKAYQLYLRRDLELTEQPERAWIEILGRESIELYINGRFVAKSEKPDLSVAIQADISRYLKVGSNVIAIVAHRKESRQRPRVTISGGYEQGGIERTLGAEETWRQSDEFERGQSYWFTAEFNDHHWMPVQGTEDPLRTLVSLPPRALRDTTDAPWIHTETDAEGNAVMHKEFSFFARAQQAWLRIYSNAPYRMLLNGSIIEDMSDTPGTAWTEPRVARVYDLLPLLRRGHNQISIAAQSPSGPVLLKADGEVFSKEEPLVTLDSDSSWLCSEGLPDGWYRSTPIDPSKWKPCNSEVGAFGAPPDEIRTRPTSIHLTPKEYLRQALLIGGVAIPIALLSILLLRLVHKIGARGRTAPRAPLRAIYLSLLPVVFAAGFLELLAWDPRFARAEVFNPWTLSILLLLLPLQWLLVFGRSAPGATIAPDCRLWAPSARTTAIILALLMAAGFWLRLKDIDLTSLHPDEVTVYRAIQGLLERGFPSFSVHENVPTNFKATSELIYPPGALVALFTDRDYLVVRLPGVIWSTLTIFLLGFVGTRMFGRNVGLVAAALYTFSPIAVEMSNFGRYFSQLQILTLAAAYSFYRALEGSGRVNRRWLWLTAASFAAMYLSWEGSVLLAPSMILAAIVVRRGKVLPLLRDGQVWLAAGAVLCVIALQYSYRTLQQTQRLWLGSGASDVSFTLMSSYPGFDPTYYLWTSSWTENALFPLLGLLGAGFLALEHGFKRPVRYLLILYLLSALLMVLLLPVRAPRYGYQFAPFLILLNSAVLIILARGLGSIFCHAWEKDAPQLWVRYTRFLTVAFVAATVAVASGATLRNDDMTWMRSGVSRETPADHRAAAEFIRQHLQEGDFILATTPHAVEHYLGRPADYWVETRLHLQAVLDDENPTLRHRLIGTEMISDRESLERVFAEKTRIWYIAVPSMHAKTNEKWVASFLRANMDLVFESPSCLVYFRGNDFRVPRLQQENEQDLQRARATILP